MLRFVSFCFVYLFNDWFVDEAMLDSKEVGRHAPYHITSHHITTVVSICSVVVSILIPSDKNQYTFLLLLMPFGHGDLSKMLE